MPELTLEKIDQRLATLEETVARLVQSEQPKPAQFKDWRKAAGMFAGHELMKEIDEAGRQIRDADRKNVQP